MKHATIYDVAEAAGVSIATVSNTLNNPARVGAATRDRVLKVIEDLGFVPKDVAFARARKSTRRVGVIAPFTSHPSFYRRLDGVFAALRGRSLEVVLFDMESPAESHALLRRLPATRSLDGLIDLAVPFDDTVAARLRSGTLPTVLMELEVPGFHCILTNDEQGGRLAGEAIAASGKRRPAFIGVWPATLEIASPSLKRVKGFRAALGDASIPLAEEDVINVPFTASAATHAAWELLSRTEPPDAVFVHSDDVAAAVLRVAASLGRRVPDDIAVVGFDDGPLAEGLQLTTIRQPLEESGALAARLLLDLLDSGDARSAPVTTLPVELVRRGSL